MIFFFEFNLQHLAKVGIHDDRIRGDVLAVGWWDAVECAVHPADPQRSVRLRRVEHLRQGDVGGAQP